MSYGKNPLVRAIVENQWNNKPWESGYKWDQSEVNKIYKVPDSHSYFMDWDQRDHAWNDA